MAVAGVVTYVYPVTGAAPPSALLAKDLVIADVAMAADSLITTITHNMGLAPADGSDGRPDVKIISASGGATAALPIVAFASLNTFTMVPSATGGTTQHTFRVYIRRPHTIGR